jgi:hypothetical protein
VLRIYPRSNVGVFAAVQRGLDWESPSFYPKRLSDLPTPRPPAPSSEQVAFNHGWGGFEADFATSFIPASSPPGGERVTAVAPIPTSALGGNYWLQLFKGKRYLLLRMLDRIEPTLSVTVQDDDRLRIRAPGGPAGGAVYRRSAVNAFTDSATHATFVFAASPRGINANSTTGSAPWFYHRLPWHYRPAITLVPLFVGFIILVSAFGYWVTNRRRPADRGVASALALGVAAVVFGWWAELQYVVPVWYHGGHLLAAVAWRTVLHLGVVGLVLGPILIVRRWGILLASTTGAVRAMKAAYLGILSLAAVVTVILTAYWGLIGTLTS